MPKCIKGHQVLHRVRKAAGFEGSRGRGAHLDVSKLAQGHDGDVGLGRGDGRSRVPGVLQQVDGLQSKACSGTEDSRCCVEMQQNCARHSWSGLQFHSLHRVATLLPMHTARCCPWDPCDNIIALATACHPTAARERAHLTPAMAPLVSSHHRSGDNGRAHRLGQGAARRLMRPAEHHATGRAELGGRHRLPARAWQRQLEGRGGKVRGRSIGAEAHRLGKACLAGQVVWEAQDSQLEAVPAGEHRLGHGCG